MKIFIPAAICLSLSSINGFAASQKGKDCVTYETSKTIMIFANKQVKGINCSIEVNWPTHSSPFFMMKGDLRKFDSGDEDRDEHVADHLSNEKNYSLSFQSQILPSLDLSQQKNLIGTLRIGNYINKVVIPIKWDKSEQSMSGSLKTTFKKLGIDAPEVGPGGIISYVNDDVSLSFKITR